MTIKEFLKRYKWLIIVLAAIPIVTIFVFSLCADLFKFITMSGGDWATLIGAILGYIGTSLLGVLAFWQNCDIEQKSEEFNKNLYNLQIQAYVPSFECVDTGCGGNYRNIFFRLLNTSENLANNIQLSGLTITDQNNNVLVNSDPPKYNKHVLLRNDSMEIEYINKEPSGKNLNLQFEITCTDKFNLIRKYITIGKIEDSKKYDLTLHTHEIVNEYNYVKAK